MPVIEVVSKRGNVLGTMDIPQLPRGMTRYVLRALPRFRPLDGEGPLDTVIVRDLVFHLFRWSDGTIDHTSYYGNPVYLMQVPGFRQHRVKIHP